jgi:hypothetical protein
MPKIVLLDFDEAVSRTIVHNFYLIEKQRMKLKAICIKMRESVEFGESMSSLRKKLRRTGFRYV